MLGMPSVARSKLAAAAGEKTQVLLLSNDI